MGGFELKGALRHYTKQYYTLLYSTILIITSLYYHTTLYCTTLLSRIQRLLNLEVPDFHDPAPRADYKEIQEEDPCPRGS